MFGFLIGTACLVGLFKVARHARYGHWGHHGGWHGRHGGGRWGGRGSWMLRGLFQRLDTTPGQEKVIQEAFEAMRATGMKFREEGEKVRKDVANAFRQPTLDHEPLKAAFLRHDQLVEDLQREVLVSLGKVHEALDERQRQEVADLFEHGFGIGRAHV